MDKLSIKVAEFHEKYGFSKNKPITAEESLLPIVNQLDEIAMEIIQNSDMSIRAHLIVEETAELVTALANGDKIALLDALADLLYVTIGTAVTFGLPLTAAFNEVHKSNMTKSIQQDRPGHPGKGKDYIAPNLDQLLEKELFNG